ELIRNKKQLTSYAGLDVKEKLSGTSVKGKPTISKKGNRYLRSCLHLPALSTIKWDDNFRDQYVRIVAKHGIKMKGCVAVQRKLLELIYVIYKNKIAYDKDYESKKNSVPAQNA
ncbi:MAG TPA: IS110 family transposase, partial [Flavobacterium sp.]